MNVGLEGAPEPVAVTATQEADRVNLVLVDCKRPFQGFHVELVVVAVNKRANKLPLVKQMNGLGWCMDEPGITGMQVVWGDKLCEYCHEVEHQQNQTRNHSQAVASEFPPHQLPLGRKVKSFLLRRQVLDGHWVEWFVRYEVVQLAAAHFVAPP